MQKKKDKKGKRYGFLSNLFFILKLVWGWDKSVLLLQLVSIPAGILLPSLTTFVPAILVSLIQIDAAASLLLAVVAAFTISEIALTFLRFVPQEKYYARINALFRRYDLMLSQKVMNMDFEIFEGPYGRMKYQKAKNSMREDGVYAFLESFIRFIMNLLGFSAYSGIIATLNPLIILILLGIQAMNLLPGLWQNRYEHKFKENHAKVDRRLNYMTKVSKDFSIAKDIRLYRMQDILHHMSEYFIGEKKFYTNKVFLSYFVTDISELVITFIMKCGVYAYLIYRTISGDIDVAAVVLYIGVIMGFSNWVGGIGSSIEDLNSQRLCVSDVREFLDIPNKMNCGKGVKLPEAATPCEIEIMGLNYTYPESESPALRDINLKIKAGERIAVVGVNGAGKTTLVKMLCGLYRPTDGNIKINGVDIGEFNRDEYYTMFSAVFQDVRVMPVSIASNVSMHTEDKTDLDKVNKCLLLAGLYDRVKSLEKGVETPLVKNVNDDGAELSGGELQKLMLARALYKESQIIILDEPTAALDPIAENEMYLKYSELTKGKTSVYISHRLSSTRFCDRIIFIDGGIIAEEGTHDELMSRGGKYAHMFEVQSSYYSSGENGGEDATPLTAEALSKEEVSAV